MSATYYYDICGNDLNKIFSPSTILNLGSQLPFIGKAGQVYSPNFPNTTISTLTLNLPTAITFDATYNNAYICSTFMGVIYRINMYTGLVNLIAGTYTTGTIASTPVSSYSSIFTYPTATAFDNSGNFYICDNAAKQISKMNLQTSMIRDIIFSPPTALPLYLLIDSANNLYFSSIIGIYKVSLLGTLPAGSAATIDSSNIYQMAFSPGNKNLIYGISPTSPVVIRVVNTTNSALSYSITMPTGVNNGAGIVFDSAGNIYFCTFTTVYMISQANIPTATTTNFATYTALTTTISYTGLRWLSIDNADNLYMTDTNGQVIYKYITNTYNTKYLLPTGNDFGTVFLPKCMLGGTSSQTGSFPLSNYIVDSTNSPIEYYIEGATYNIIDNSGLVCHYMFNSQDIVGVTVANYASGSLVYDASMSAAGLGYQKDYILGNGCLNLVGANSQYVQVTNTTITTTAWPPAGGLSFSFWVNTYNNANYSRVFDFGNGAPSNNILLCIYQGGILATVYNGSSSINTSFTISNFNTGAWTHLVWVINANGSYSFYVNGKLNQTTAVIQYPVAIARTKCYIGRSNWVDPYYTGQIDDFRIYQRAITGIEAFELYSFNGLSLYYKFDTEDVFKGDGVSIANYASGYPIYDASLSAVNSQINGISSTSSMVGNACMCLSGNYLNIPTPNISTNGFTVAFWMNTTSTNQNYPPLLFLNGNGTYNVYIYITNIGGTEYSIGYECRSNGTTARKFLYTTISINDGVWHYIVLTSTYATFGSATSTVRIYIDNVLNSSMTTGYYPNTAGLIAGSTIGGGTPGYNGLIDDYRIYSRVLSPQEITALYTFTYTPDELAVTAIGPATFTVTTPRYPGITATVTTTPAVTHVDTVTNNIYKTVLSGLSQNVGYGYTFTYTNGLVLTGNTTLYSAPTAPTVNYSSTTSSITISTQSYSGIPTTAAYFYINGLVIQGTYSSNIYSTTLSGLPSNTSYALISNIMNNNSIGQTKSTVYTLPNIPTITVTTINPLSVVFTFTTTDTIAPSSYSIVINSQTFTSATNIVTATGLSSNTSYSYYGYVSNTAVNSANTTSANVSTIPNTPTSATISLLTTISATLTIGGSTGSSYSIIINGQTFTNSTSAVPVSGLSQNTNYTYNAYVTNSSGNSSYYTGSILTLPSIPTNIVASTIGTISIIFTITASGTLSSYKIVINGQTFTSATNTVTATGLSSNTSYSYYGYVSNTAGNSANTTATNIYTLIANPQMTVTTQNTTSIVFTDATSYSGLTSYVIKAYGNSAYTGTTINSATTAITGASNQITVSGLTANTQYWYQIVATNTNNTSNTSLTTYGSSNVVTTFTIPNAPTSVLITPNYFSATVAITAASNGPLALTYKLVYNASNFTGSSITSLSGLTMGTTYSYTLTSYNNASYPSASLTGTFITFNFVNTGATSFTNNSILFDTPGAKSFTLTAGKSSNGNILAISLPVTYEMTSGGGGGGGSAYGSTYQGAGGGGGSGQYIKNTTTLTNSIAYSITIGTGGAGGGAGGNGSAGSNTIALGSTALSTSNYGLKGTVIAGGGGGGGSAYKSNSGTTTYTGGTTAGGGGGGGAGTNGNASNSGAMNGANGGLGVTSIDGTTLVCYGGGGGGNGANSGLGGAGNGTSGTAGSSDIQGTGGQAVSNTRNAATYGSGGGGGGVTNTGVVYGGGAGKDGHFYMTYTLT